MIRASGRYEALYFDFSFTFAIKFGLENTKRVFFAQSQLKSSLKFAMLQCRLKEVAKFRDLHCYLYLKRKKYIRPR